MNRLTHIVAVSILAICALAPAAAADLKIGVVNVTRLLEQSPQAIAAQKRLEEDFAERDKDLLDQQKEIKRLDDRLDQEGDSMGEAERSKLDRDIRQRKRDLRRGLEELREDRTIRTNEELGKLQRVVNEAIKAVGEAEGYDLILYEGIAYVKPTVNLTNKILERLREDSQAQ